MEEHEFRRILDLFPVVRSRSYCADSEKESKANSSTIEVGESKNPQNERDNKEDKDTELEEAFWEKLRMAAEEKVGPTNAEKFCKAFHRVHRELIDKRLTPDAARKYLGA